MVSAGTISNPIILESTTSATHQELRKEWIGKGKQYKDVPDFIEDLRSVDFAIPPSIAELIPKATLNTKEFLKKTQSLPDRCNGFVFRDALTTFSDAEPNERPEVVITRPVPSHEYLVRLYDTSRQAWLDGRRSILDPRYPGLASRLPLWAVTFYMEVSRILDGRRKWMRSLEWLGRVKSRDGSAASHAVIDEVHKTLERLGWNETMHGLRTQARALSLSLLLSDDWLNDDVIDMLTVLTRSRYLELAPEGPAQSVEVANLAFYHSISTLAEATKQPYNKTSYSYLWDLGMSLGAKKDSQLYFILNVKASHWAIACIDFTTFKLRYGDSLGIPMPRTLFRALGRWVTTHFPGKKLVMAEERLPSSLQSDSWSCGVIACNTLQLCLGITKTQWVNKAKDEMRIQYFIDIISFHFQSLFVINADSTTEAPCELAPEALPTVAVTLGDPMCDIEGDDSSESGDDIGLHSSPETSDAEVDDTMDGEDVAAGGSRKPESGEGTPRTLGGERSLIAKRAPPSSSVLSGPVRKKPKVQDLERSGVVGISESATRDRLAREQANANTLELDPTKWTRFKKGVLNLDSKAKLDPKDPRHVSHSICGKSVAMKTVYNLGRFKDHCTACTQETFKAKNPGRQSTNLLSYYQKIPDAGALIQNPKKLAPPVRPEPGPCPGLTEGSHPRILIYLRRTVHRGGGGRSELTIAKRHFPNLVWAKLSREKKKHVRLLQTLTWRWINDHNNALVRSAGCEGVVTEGRNGQVEPCYPCRSLLSLRDFKTTLAYQPPPSENLKYNTLANRVAGSLGELFAGTKGLLELVQADPKKSHYLRFAQGVAQGQWDGEGDAVFLGLVEAMVSKKDREVRGVGLQNFRYNPHYEDFTHQMAILSPRTYKAFSQNFQGRDLRSFARVRSTKPRFPIGIGESCFKAAQQYLNDIGYSGPLALGCDDTKLLEALKPYHDASEKRWYLVGNVGQPIAIADIEALHEILHDSTITKATKVRLWVITPPLPKVPPIMLAALPINSSLKAKDLFVLHQQIMSGLLALNLHVVSYGADGTETERQVQRMFASAASKTIESRFPHPYSRPGDSDIVVTVPFMQAHSGEFLPFANVQDSKHARKTARNNLYSGARLLVLGNFIACYGLIAKVLDYENSPLMKRDVIKLDRQDDLAAARLFSAKTLDCITLNNPDWIGVTVYLFIFGELVDAWQNRSISHWERIRMVFRARFFLDEWRSFLQKGGYSEARHFISREAHDISSILINSFLTLIIIYRDHIPGPAQPFLPWMHGTEANEHFFGLLRAQIADFTFLDLLYAAPKIAVLIGLAYRTGSSTSSKGRTTGYYHTQHLFNERLDSVSNLSHFPSDAEIQDEILCAAEEATSLWGLLGVEFTSGSTGEPLNSSASPVDVHQADDTTGDEFYQCASAELFDSHEVMGSSHRLMQMLSEEETTMDRTHKADGQLLEASFAAVSLLIEDTLKAFEASEYVDENAAKSTADTREQVAMLLGLRDLFSAPPSGSKETIEASTADFSSLVRLRLLHQTNEAETGVRTSKNHPSSSSEREKAGYELIKHMNRVIRESEETIGSSTGLNRKIRWKQERAQDTTISEQAGSVNGSTSTPSTFTKTGNAANAAVVGANAARADTKRRRDMLKTAKVQPACEELCGDACIRSNALGVVDGLKDGSFGFVLHNESVLLAKVLTMYSRGGGKRAAHSWISEPVQSIGEISYLAVQLFEFVAERRFRPNRPNSRIPHHLVYAHLPSNNFLTIISSTHQPQISPSGLLRLSEQSFQMFCTLNTDRLSLAKAVKSMNTVRKRGQKNGDLTEIIEELEEA